MHGDRLPCCSHHRPLHSYPCCPCDWIHIVRTDDGYSKQPAARELPSLNSKLSTPLPILSEVGSAEVRRRHLAMEAQLDLDVAVLHLSSVLRNALGSGLPLRLRGELSRRLERLANALPDNEAVRKSLKRIKDGLCSIENGYYDEYVRISLLLSVGFSLDTLE